MIENDGSEDARLREGEGLRMPALTTLILAPRKNTARG